MQESLWQPKATVDVAAPTPMPELIWRILSAKQITDNQQIETLLQPSLKNLAHPFVLTNLEKATQRLHEAFLKNEKICVYADFDLDGTSGLALMLKGLKDLGYDNVIHYQPKRLSEGYGVHVKAIEELKNQGVDVVITVDVGITAHDAAIKAKELGIDFIITDHHLPKETLPEAYTVVNPNQNACDSNLGYLCGAGVAFYFLLGLKLTLNKKNILTPEFNPKELLDCFVIGTLTDLVPLVHENRVLVKHGLVALEKTKRPGLKKLLEALGMGNKALTGSDVAIRFAPKLNALSRLELGVMPIDLFLIEDEKKADQLIKKVLSFNDKRIHLQKKSEDQALDWLKKRDQQHIGFMASEEFHKGVVGLVATKVAQTRLVPAFIGSVNNEGIVTGSCRRPDHSNISLLDGLEAVAGHMIKFGGHAPAAGFMFEYEKFELIEKGLEDFYKVASQQEEQRQIFEYDVKAQFSEITPVFMRWFDQLGPFGVGFEAPLFLFENLSVEKITELRGGHFKFSLKARQELTKADALWFSPSKFHPVLKKGMRPQDIVDILAEPQWNFFNGRKSLQYLIKDIRFSV